MNTQNYKINSELDLVFEREVDVPVEVVWAAWTKPEHVVHWFTPAPWKTIDCRVDLRPGGEFFTMMQSPEGQNFLNVGCYLEVVENQKLVWTVALKPGYRPAVEDDFHMSLVLLLEKTAKGTKYTAIALHKDAEGRKKHEAMGFQDGWGKALDQLVSYMKNVAHKNR
jgi:uncharacterized protein YndB with AHSA1/START domain